MSLRDCLNSAVEQGAINSREADELNRYYEARFRKNRAKMSDREAAAAARAEVVAELRADAAEQRRQVLLSEARRKEIADFMEGYRNRKGEPDQLDAALSLMIHNGFKGTSSMEGKANAIIAMAHRDLSEVMYHFRRSKGLGRRLNKVDLPDLIKAMHGEKTANETAGRLATALSGVLEDLRQRFNAAGGNIPVRQDWGIVHSHNRRLIRKLGRTPDEARAKWKAFITPLLDADQMTNPKTGERIGADGLDASLDYVFETITSDGWAHRKPEARRFGKGKLANRHQDSRFLIFRDAQSWLTYNEKFGNNDAIGSIFNHINSMARDIAAMERFGPNPDATMDWIKQAVQVNIGRQQAGAVPVFGKAPGLSAVKWAGYRVESLWHELRGRETVLDAPAKWTGDIRNLVTSAVLGGTGLLSAVTDPFVAQAGRRLAGLPIASTLMDMVKAFANDGDRRAMARRAVIWDDYLHTMNESARFVDQMFGHEWSRYLVDRSLTWNALSPLTDARKRIEASAWHETLGGFAEKATDWMDMPPLLKNTMEGFGISESDWHKMRAGVDEMGFLDPGGVFEKTGNRGLAEKYAEMITQWSERSVPAGDPRIRSVITGMVPRGTIAGGIIDFALQFKAFAMSFTARQLEAIYLYSMIGRSTGGKVARGAWYFAAMSIPLMMGAGAYMQFMNIMNGKDPDDMTEPAFWLKAFIKGGGGGMFADFVGSTQSRFGGTATQTLVGPGLAFVSDTWDLTVGYIFSLIGGDGEKKYGREVTKYIGRYTPILSSHPATRLVYRRAVVDQLQTLTDPDADASFKAQKRKNAFWWEPGELTFRRLPNPAAAGGAPE